MMKPQIETELFLIVQKAQQISVDYTDLLDRITKLGASLDLDSPSEPAAPSTPSVPPAPKPPEYEELRGLLAELMAKGKRTEVKELIQRYGCGKLSQVDARYHQELWEKARALL